MILMHADARVERLLADLDEAISLLEKAGETHWLAWLQRGRSEVAQGDAHGLERLLGGFGGMGSFNDLVLTQPNASAPRDFLREANDRLWDLRQSIWQTAQDLKHEVGQAD
jgi:hypothetical protein